jgi:hypothetical protein
MDSRTLLDRLAEAAQAIDKVKKTGHAAANQGGGLAYSIEDLEGTVGGALADAGVVCGYTFNDLRVIEERGESGANKLWLADLNYELRAPGDDMVVSHRLMDVGTSPSSAVGYCIKRWQRSFGHVTSDGDQQGSGGWSGGTRPYESGTAGPMPCPNPAHEKVTGLPPYVPGLRISKDDPNGSYCWKKNGGCGWSGPTPEAGSTPLPPEDGEIPPSEASQESRDALAGDRIPGSGATPAPGRLPTRQSGRSTVGPTPRTRQVAPDPPPPPTHALPVESVDPMDFPPIDAGEEVPPPPPMEAPSPSADLIEQYADAIEVVKAFDGTVKQVKVDPTVSDEELTKMVFTHAVELKRLQLKEKGDVKADYSGYVAEAVKTSLDAYCAKKFDRPFAQATNDECRSMIGNFVAAIVGYGAKGVS